MYFGITDSNKYYDFPKIKGRHVLNITICGEREGLRTCWKGQGMEG